MELFFKLFNRRPAFCWSLVQWVGGILLALGPSINKIDAESTPFAPLGVGCGVHCFGESSHAVCV